MLLTIITFVVRDIPKGIYVNENYNNVIKHKIQQQMSQSFWF